MDDLQIISKAAKLAGVARQSVTRWVQEGLLKGTPIQIGNLNATLVSIRAVKELAKQRRPGRPRKRG
jgi:hypothetical protein